MTNRDIDDVLKRATEPPNGVDPALLDRISASLNSGLRPVRPLPSTSILGTSLVLMAASVAVTGGIVLGPHGIQKMRLIEMGLIFAVLGILVWVAALVCVAEMIPGSRRRAAPAMLAVTGCAALATVFGTLFHDYGTERFVSQGVTCLVAGLAQAVPAYVATWWILNRGFAVNAVAADFAKGILAGLAGVVMLELHCANFEAPHVIVWHIAVLPISGTIAALGVWIRIRGARRLASG